MENFVKVLSAGLAVFALFVILSSLGPFAPEQPAEEVNATIFATELIGTIGFGQVTPREISIGNVTVGNLVADENVFYADNDTIQNGVFGKKTRSITFSGNDAKKAVLSFYVKETNSYGRLYITFNGLPVYGEIAAPGPYRFEFYGLNSTDANTVDIFAESSGIKFWAPTTYVLDDLTATVERYASRDRAVPFQVYTYEASGWSLGRILFSRESVQGPGNLTIDVNGKTVYDDIPAPDIPLQLDFSRTETSVSAGENVMTFKTARDTVYSLKNTRLVIFYYGTGEAVYKIQEFDVNEYWRAQLRKENVTGIVSFFVKAAPLDTGIDVALNNRTFTFIRAPPNMWYNFTFGENDLSNETRNTLKFSTHGSYDIGTVTVSIASKNQ